MTGNLDIHPALTKQHADYRQKIRQFAEIEIKPLADQLDKEGAFSMHLTKRLGEMGLLGIMIPKKYGGQELDSLSYIIAVEELARIDGSQAATVAAHNSLGVAPILNYGTEKQKSYFLPRLTTGEKLWAFGLTEANAGSDAMGVNTKAELREGEWHINGSKIFITNSSSDAAAGVTALSITGMNGDRKEMSAILIERTTEGYSTEVIGNKMMWRAADTGKINFATCRVPEENLLGERGNGGPMMLETLDSGRLSIAAMGLGLAQGAFEMAMEYAQKREQFKRPISQFQAVSFKLADMAMKIELARNTLYKACWQKDSKIPFGKEAAMAKLYCSEIAKEVADQSLQIHGGYGLTREYAIERFYRDQRILQIGEGTSEILRLVISRHLGL